MTKNTINQIIENRNVSENVDILILRKISP